MELFQDNSTFSFTTQKCNTGHHFQSFYLESFWVTSIYKKTSKAILGLRPGLSLFFPLHNVNSFNFDEKKNAK